MNHKTGIIAKSAVLIMAVVMLLSVCLTSCGKVEEFKYVKCQIKMTIGGMDGMDMSQVLAPVETQLKNTYDTMYKDAVIKLGDNKLTMVLTDDAEAEMTYEEKDGKNVLAGDYIQTMIDATATASGENGEGEMYFIVEGDTLTMYMNVTMSVSGVSSTVECSFVFEK